VCATADRQKTTPRLPSRSGAYFAHDVIAADQIAYALTVVNAYPRDCLALKVDFASRRLPPLLEVIVSFLRQVGSPDFRWLPAGRMSANWLTTLFDVQRKLGCRRSEYKEQWPHSSFS
jgi:hypothetical protein